MTDQPTDRHRQRYTDLQRLISNLHKDQLTHTHKKANLQSHTYKKTDPLNGAQTQP